MWDELQDWLTAREGQPRLVHGDFCPPNCYVTVLPDGRPVVTGVGDFSPHTLNADPMMDVAGAIMFLELEQYPGAGEDARRGGGQRLPRAPVERVVGRDEADAGAAHRIAVASIPDEGLGVAINDRLRRAAAPRTESADVE